MSLKTYVFFKAEAEDTVVNVNISSLLATGETVANLVVGTVSPSSPVPLVVTLQSSTTSPNLVIDLEGGNDGVSYGCTITVHTNLRVFNILLAISVMTDDKVPYTTLNPDAYSALIDTIQAGEAAIGKAIFVFPNTVDPSGGFITWELLGTDSVVYASGNCYEYLIQSSGLTNTVIGNAIVSVPTSIPETLYDQKYQLRWTLNLNGQQQFAFENISVVGLNTVPLGVQPAVEIQGTNATSYIVIDKLYDTVGIEIYMDNASLGGFVQVNDFKRVSSGYFYAAEISTTGLPVMVEPYNVIWRYWNSDSPSYKLSENAELWVVNPSILQAINDVKAKINKARTTLYGTPDLLYPEATILTWLRRGKDAFNGAAGIPTSFTMTNAKGAIREYWLMFAEMEAIRSQYLAEGEKAFNFSGQAISLDVDRTSYLDSAASAIQSRLDNEMKPFKVNLTYKGNTGGDGSEDPTKLKRGAIGTVGISISPVSQWGRFPYIYPGRLR